ncbi:DUF4239 domain-containing protein [Cystobacter fuscus]|uniref:bestrophin-like domain n=1 Tax=Cystobacter fuscus TaxID=43 RepID=UPI002B30A6C7|nr:DUF4239 domain-containing protein [Cystobacter fuscus]
MLWLYSIDSWLLCLIGVGLTLALGLIGMLLTRRWVHAHWSRSKDVVGFYLSATGVIYAVLLATIAVAAWQNYTQLELGVSQEANLVGNVYHDLEGYPEPARSQMRQALLEYTVAVISRDWPQMRNNLPVDGSTGAADKLIGAWARFKPANSAEVILHTETFSVLNHILGLRRQRIQSADISLLPVLWVVVLLGGFINIALTWLVTTDDVRLNILLTGGYCVSVGLMIFLIVALDHPFWGDVSVGPGAFEFVRSTMERPPRVAF